MIAGVRFSSSQMAQIAGTTEALRCRRPGASDRVKGLFALSGSARDMSHASHCYRKT